MEEIRLSDVDGDVSRAQLGVRRPCPVLVVSGTTGELDADLAKRLLPMLAVAVAVAGEHEVAIVSGGTDAGIFHLLDLALSSSSRAPRTVVGVAPDALVTTAAGADSDPQFEAGRVAPASELSVLVRVPADRWGDETEAMTRVVMGIASGRPAVLLLAGGGEVSQRELVQHLARGCAVVVISGTGRLADAVASVSSGDLPDSDAAAEKLDDDLMALLTTGDVHVIDVGDTARLRSLLTRLLAPAPRRRWPEGFALLTALPRLRFRPEPSAGLLHPDVARRYGHLQEQIDDADRTIYPFFLECDLTAQIEQNRHRWFTVLAIIGGLLTTVSGALQAWLQSTPWPGVLVATFGAATSALTTVGRQQGALQGYLAARVRAERLRSLYFEYLASPPAPDPAARHKRLSDLERRVVRIQSEPVTP